MKDQNYVNQLERAVHVLTNSNSNWDINVSVWDKELILSIQKEITRSEFCKLWLGGESVDDNNLEEHV